MAKVYVMDNGRYRKVGFSAKPELRAKQVGQGLPIAVVYTVETSFPRAVERAAHDLLLPHRVSREWFDVTAEVAIEAVNTALHCHGSENVVYKVIRFTPAQLEVLEAVRAKTGGTYADAIMAAIDAYMAQRELTNAELLRMLADRIESEIEGEGERTTKPARGGKAGGGTERREKP
jgi:hypothetical protein